MPTYSFTTKTKVKIVIFTILRSGCPLEMNINPKLHNWPAYLPLKLVIFLNVALPFYALTPSRMNAG